MYYIYIYIDIYCIYIYIYIDIDIDIDIDIYKIKKGKKIVTKLLNFYIHIDIFKKS